jgi:hypothetical protein
MVPQLLAHLDVSHVSIASHSGGDIYLMNTILTHPSLLHPTNPYVCFFAPWVHYTHSRVPHLLATGLLPASLIGKFGALGKFVNQNVVPVVGLSGSLVTGFKASLQSSGPLPGPVALTAFNATSTPEPSNGSSGGLQDIDLDDIQVVDELRNEITKFVFAENVDGVSADTQLFLKRTVTWRSPNIDWEHGLSTVSMPRTTRWWARRENSGSTTYGYQARVTSIEVATSKAQNTTFCWTRHSARAKYGYGESVKHGEVQSLMESLRSSPYPKVGTGTNSPFLDPGEWVSLVA